MEDLRKFPNLTVDQKDLLNRFYDQFNYASPGVNRHIANVQELHYQGAIAASEFTIYAATKLYLCFDFETCCSDVATIAIGLIQFFNENNVLFLYTQNNSIIYEPIGAAINYAKNNLNMKNLWFSRIDNNGYNYMKFIGYRITLD